MIRYLIVFIFCSVELLSQDPDTLLSTILKLENDTEKVNRLYTQGFGLVDKDPQLAYIYARNCEKSAQKSGSLKHISKSYNLSGILYLTNGDYNKAILNFEKYISTTKASGNTLGVAFGLTNLGNSYIRLKQFQKAENYYLMALDLYNELNNKTEVANGLINLGVLKHEQKQLVAALHNYEQALKTGIELNDYGIKAICLNNMAQIFSDHGNYEKAMAYNYDALELRELMGLDVDKADSYLSIAEVALKQKDPTIAEENLNLALTLCEQLDYPEGKTFYHKLASQLFAMKNDFRSAYEQLRIYTSLNDSLTALQLAATETSFPEETGLLSLNKRTGSIRNMWLLISLGLLVIFIPFILIRYKR